MVRSINFSTAAAFSTALFLFTFSNALAAPLSDPSNAAANTISTSEIDISWNDNSSKETGFKIERSLDGTNFTEVATVGKNIENFSDTTLDSGTTYFYKVRAYKVKRNSTSYSGYTNVANDTTFDVVPADPNNVSAIASSSSNISIFWNDNSDNETGFSLERSIDGTNFSVIATPNENVTFFNDTNLDSNTTYYYKVRAVNAVGNSDYSNTDSATTFDATPAAPANLNVYATSSALALYWTDNSNNEDYFEIEKGTDGIIFSLLNTSTTPYYTDFTGNSTTTFYYRVRAVNAAGNSAYTNVSSGMAF